MQYKEIQSRDEDHGQVFYRNVAFFRFVPEIQQLWLAMQDSNILMVYTIDGRLIARIHVAGSAAVHKPIDVKGLRPRQDEDLSGVQNTVQGMASTGKYSQTQLVEHVKAAQQELDAKWAASYLKNGAPSFGSRSAQLDRRMAAHIASYETSRKMALKMEKRSALKQANINSKRDAVREMEARSGGLLAKSAVSKRPQTAPARKA